VSIYNLVTKATAEERIIQRAQQKLAMQWIVLHEQEDNCDINKVNDEDEVLHEQEDNRCCCCCCRCSWC
jgi:SNF2 family DNA or RNA helicase